MPKLTPDDLQFLICAKVALRFQYSEYDGCFQEKGEIKGDAYSLSDPEKWHPPTEAKAEEFERELKNKVRTVFTSEMVGRDNYDGSFLLLKDVDGAHNPVDDKPAYKSSPFLPVAAFTTFYSEQVIGRVEISRDLVVNQLGFYRDRPNPEVVEKVVDHITDKIIDQIVVQQGQQTTDQISAIHECAQQLTKEQKSQEEFKKLRASLGLEPKH